MLCVGPAVVMVVLASAFVLMRINGLHRCGPASSCCSALHYPCMFARTHSLLMLISLCVSFQSWSFILFSFLCHIGQTRAVYPHIHPACCFGCFFYLFILNFKSTSCTQSLWWCLDRGWWSICRTSAVWLKLPCISNRLLRGLKPCAMFCS